MGKLNIYGAKMEIAMGQRRIAGHTANREEDWSEAFENRERERQRTYDRKRKLRWQGFDPVGATEWAEGAEDKERAATCKPPTPPR